MLCLFEPATECSDYPVSSKAVYHCFCCWPLNTSMLSVTFCMQSLQQSPVCCCTLQACLSCRIVVVAMVISLGGVVMIAKPSFLFGGKGINKLGLVLALMQVSITQLLSLRAWSIKCIHWRHCSPNTCVEGILYQMQLLRALSTKCAHRGHCLPTAFIEGTVHQMHLVRALSACFSKVQRHVDVLPCDST